MISEKIEKNDLGKFMIFFLIGIFFGCAGNFDSKFEENEFFKWTEIFLKVDLSRGFFLFPFLFLFELFLYLSCSVSSFPSKESV